MNPSPQSPGQPGLPLPSGFPPSLSGSALSASGGKRSFQKKLLSLQSNLLTEEAKAEIAQGTLPNLNDVCQELLLTFSGANSPYSALQFVPVLKKLEAPAFLEVGRFSQHPKSSHVLVQNELLKVVLIYWEPGKVTRIHGHPEGGCVFKVLHGKLEEKRCSPDEIQQLLAVSQYKSGSMAYIDDEMGYHAVGNPFEAPALSLHVYAY